MAFDHLDRMARVYGPRDDGLSETLDRSLNPRGPDMLLDIAGAYLQTGDRILDIGCRDASYLIRLVQAHDGWGVGLDPVEWNVERARAAVAEAGLADRIEITKGVMERIEQPDDHFDFLWCRDVLPLVERLDDGLAEAARVLKPGGAMLIYTSFATELLEPKEAAAMHGPLGNVPANVDEVRVEAALQRAGFAIDRKEAIGTEWREYEEERERRVSQDLLRLARLRRRRDAIVEEYGRKRYDLAEASLQWRAFHFLGKLQPTVYVVTAP